MAQHDYNLANQSGADFRADLNDALAAIATTNSGATSPSTTFAHQLWVDTANSVLKIRNSANDAWITTGVSITADNTFDINGGTVNDITSFSFSTGSIVTSILDEDDLSSDSATALATQQSIKAYVDSQVATVDTLAEILLNGNTTGGTDIAVSTGDDITFADSSKAIFGTGSDLQIYHTGTQNYIEDVGTGNLNFKSNGNNFNFLDGSDNLVLQIDLNSATKLYHNTSEKLATTSSGIDVTGTVVSDGLTVDGVASIDAGGNNTHTIGRLIIDYAGSGNPKLMSEGGDQISIDADLNIVGGEVIKATSQPSHFNFKQARTGYDIAFYTSPTANNTFVKALDIASNGDISFYDDTGSTQGLFWDASAESLSIGATSTAGNAKFYLKDGSSGQSYSNVSGMLIDVNGTSNSFYGLRVGSSTGNSHLAVTNAGRVGIGTDNPVVTLNVDSDAQNEIARFQGANAQLRIDNNTLNVINLNSGGSGDALALSTGGSEAIRIEDNQNVGIGTSSPDYALDVRDDANIQLKLASTTATNNARMVFAPNNSIKWNIGVNYNDNELSFYDQTTATTPVRFEQGAANNTLVVDSNSRVGIGTNAPTQELTVAGNVSITGSISKGSGSFKIDHPLESKKDTHHLVHSFVEAPQADNIYRGKSELVNGTVSINIDEYVGMTEGTFVALNRQIQVFTSNETDWDAVKGNVTGNTLTITSQNTESNAEVSWLVIGERQDANIYKSDLTDNNGKIIIEPTK